MNLEEKIESFKKLVEQEPNSDLAHFSLGQAYFDSGRFAEAVLSFQRVLQLKPEFSKAYQLLAESQKAAGQIPACIETLKKGYVIAFQGGQLMPRDAMGKMLQELGQPVPQLQHAIVNPSQPSTFSGEAISCQRCRQRAPKLAKPPQPGALGQKIFEEVCQNCWKEWLAMGVKVINELRLDFTRPGAAQAYDHHMKEFLGIQDHPGPGFQLHDLSSKPRS